MLAHKKIEQDQPCGVAAKVAERRLAPFGRDPQHFTRLFYWMYDPY